MTDSITFFLDGAEVRAAAGESIWQVAKREGNDLPHLCSGDGRGESRSGNCRACMVEIEGERRLSASCCRLPTDGMQVRSQSERAVSTRKLVMELLIADQPSRESSQDRNARIWQMADAQGIKSSRFPTSSSISMTDQSHSAITVRLDSCISCQLCVTACRDVQVNDVIGLVGRGANARIGFDLSDPLAESSCVACGECVEACPTGALTEASLVGRGGAGLLEEGQGFDRHVNSVCPFCGVGCQITYNLLNDRIITVDGRDGPSNGGRLCVKGRFGMDYVYHQDRLTTPLVRLPGKLKIPNEAFDPANPYTHFRDASWEEALEVAASGLTSIRDRHGAGALAGLGSAKGSNEEAYLFQKMVRTGFGTNNVDHCTRLCHASSVAALLEGVGSGAVSASFMEIRNADAAIVIGANPTSCHPVAASLFKNASRDGTKLIIIDPRANVLEQYASHMVKLRPGTDVALLNAMMSVIIEEGLYDQAYIDRHTEGFAELKTQLAGITPETMAEICGVPPEVIREAARTYAKAPSAMIFWGMGVAQHTHGTDNARCLISLALMTGHIGKPGNGLHPLRGQNNVQGASDAGLIPMMYPDYKRVDDDGARADFEALWQTGLNATPGLTVVEIMDAARSGDIKAMYIQGENPAMSDPDTARTRAALAELEHLVVQDIFATETAVYADVILPAAAFPEKNGTFTNSNRQVQMGRAVSAPPGDARQDWWIINEVARRLGLEWNYGHPKDVYAEMTKAMASLANITWDRLEREDSVTYPCVGPDVPGQDVVFTDVFPREGGRARFVATEFIKSDELPDDEYPMYLSTGRILEHWHTGVMTRRAARLDDIEPEAMVDMNANDIIRYGLQPGERVRVVTRRGSVELPVRSDGRLVEGQLFLPFCYAEAPANQLTNPTLDPFGKIPEFKVCAARLEKLERWGSG